MQQQDQPPARGAASGRFGRLVTALAAGIIGGLVAPLVYPALARNARPVTRKAMKAGIAAFERGPRARCGVWRAGQRPGGGSAGGIRRGA